MSFINGDSTAGQEMKPPMRYGPIKRTQVDPNNLSSLNGCAQVIDTTELLEMILTRLDIASLVRYHRVSKAMKSFIETSLPIQKALFLTADHNDQTFEANPILTNTLRAFGLSYSKYKFNINPLQPPLGPEDMRRRMLFCQPPKEEIRVFLCFDCYRPATRERPARVDKCGHPYGGYPLYAEDGVGVRYSDVEVFVAEKMAQLEEGSWELDVFRSGVKMELDRLWA